MDLPGGMALVEGNTQQTANRGNLGGYSVDDSSHWPGLYAGIYILVYAIVGVDVRNGGAQNQIFFGHPVWCRRSDVFDSLRFVFSSLRGVFVDTCSNQGTSQICPSAFFTSRSNLSPPAALDVLFHFGLVSLHPDWKRNGS